MCACVCVCGGLGCATRKTRRWLSVLRLFRFRSVCFAVLLDNGVLLYYKEEEQS
eukprot:SAG22_NODE_16371_length_326_cov_1.374449_1_plen_53_part_10